MSAKLAPEHRGRRHAHVDQPDRLCRVGIEAEQIVARFTEHARALRDRSL